MKMNKNMNGSHFKMDYRLFLGLLFFVFIYTIQSPQTSYFMNLFHIFPKL